jgi:hypothetical protein
VTFWRENFVFGAKVLSRYFLNESVPLRRLGSDLISAMLKARSRLEQIEEIGLKVVSLIRFIRTNLYWAGSGPCKVRAWVGF